MSTRFQSVGARPVFIGVVHLGPTPGAPGFDRQAAGPGLGELLEAARADARALVEGGVDGLIVENYGDVPFHAGAVPPETVAALALAVDAVGELASDVPVGVNVLRNDARAALGICATTRASFFRVNVHTGAMVTDQGLVEGRAAETLRMRAALAPDALVVADVHVKHATPLGGETLVEAAEDAWHRGRADVLVLTGSKTGRAVDGAELALVRERLPEAPLWIGSGLDASNADELLRHATGAIVGTSLKEDGRVERPVDPARVARLRRAFDG